MSLDQLQPPPSQQKELLNQMILNLTKEEFYSKMLTFSAQRGIGTLNDDTNSGVNENDDACIQVDESQGIFSC